MRYTVLLIAVPKFQVKSLHIENLLICHQALIIPFLFYRVTNTNPLWLVCRSVKNINYSGTFEIRMSTKRSAYWDNWKGLAIIAVVAIHVSNSTGTFPEGSFSWWYGVWFRQLVNYAVPMFLALAGYFAASSIKKRAIEYYRERLWRLILPYAIWTVFYIVIHTPSVPPSATEIINGFILGKGIGIGYFVIVLIQYILLTPFLVRIHSIRTHILIICVCTLFGLIFCYYFRTQTSCFFSHFPGSGLLFIVWYPFYHFGLLVGSHKNELNFDCLKPSVALTALFIGFFLALLEGSFWAHQGFYLVGRSQVKVSSYAVSMILFVVAISYVNRKSWLNSRSLLTWLGQNSYGIYLIHLLFLRFFRKIFKHVELLYSVQPVYILLTTASVIVGCVVFISLFRKLFPDHISSIVVG